MATVVLMGLLYQACELYIDDILVFGKDEEDFLTNLKKVFERLRKHRVTLNPKKCRFGMEKVEYVGHVVCRRYFLHRSEKRQSPRVSCPKDAEGYASLFGTR